MLPGWPSRRMTGHVRLAPICETPSWLDKHSCLLASVVQTWWPSAAPETSVKKDRHEKTWIKTVVSCVCLQYEEKRFQQHLSDVRIFFPLLVIWQILQVHRETWSSHQLLVSRLKRAHEQTWVNSQMEPMHLSQLRSKDTFKKGKLRSYLIY